MLDLDWATLWNWANWRRKLFFPVLAWISFSAQQLLDTEKPWKEAVEFLESTVLFTVISARRCIGMRHPVHCSGSFVADDQRKGFRMHRLRWWPEKRVSHANRSVSEQVPASLVKQRRQQPASSSARTRMCQVFVLTRTVTLQGFINFPSVRRAEKCVKDKSVNAGWRTAKKIPNRIGTRTQPCCTPLFRPKRADRAPSDGMSSLNQEQQLLRLTSKDNISLTDASVWERWRQKNQPTFQSSHHTLWLCCQELVCYQVRKIHQRDNTTNNWTSGFGLHKSINIDFYMQGCTPWV